MPPTPRRSPYRVETSPHQKLDFSHMTPQEVVTLLRVSWGDSDTKYNPPKDIPLKSPLAEVVLVHLDDIAANDHDRAKATLDAFSNSPWPDDRANASALLVSYSWHDHDTAMPYWERFVCDANSDVRGEYRSYLGEHLHDHDGAEDDLIESVGLVASDVRYLLQLQERAVAEGTLVDLGQLAVEKLIAMQPETIAAGLPPAQA